MENKFDMLSSIQKSIWISESKYPNSCAFNVGGYAKIRGVLNVDVLNEAIKIRLNQCDVITDGRLGRNIISKKKVNQSFYFIEYIDFSNKNEPLVFCNDYLEQDISKLIDADKYLIEIKILKASDFDFYWYVKVHHMFFDGYSMSLFFNDVSFIYSSILNGSHTNVDFSKYLYSNFVADEVAYKASNEYQLDRVFWLNKLSKSNEFNSGFLSCIKASQTGLLSSKRSQLILSRLTFNRIKDLCVANENCSVFHYFISIILLLNKSYNNSNILIGLPVFNRSTKFQKKTLGTFVNTLPFSIEIPQDITFSELLKLVKGETKNLFRHQKFSIADLSDDIDLTNNVYNILFSYQKIIYENALEGLDFNINYLHCKEQLDDMAIHLLEYSDDDDLLICFDHKTSVFDKIVIENFIRHFESLTHLFLDDPDLEIKNLTYLSSNEEQLLLEEFNNSQISYPKDKTLVNLFETQVKQNPGKIALAFGSVELTYKELNERSNQLGSYLRKTYSIKADDLIAIKMDRSIEMIVSILGVLKSGGAYVPVDPEYPQERIDYMLADSGCKVLIDCIELEKFNAVAENYSKQNLKLINKPKDLVYVIYTSGSTGMPKGVMVEHFNLTNFLQNLNNKFSLGSNIVFAAITNFTFDISILELLCTIVNGIKTVLIPEKDPISIFNYINTHGVNAFQITPSRLSQFFESNSDSLDFLSQLKVLLIGGEPLGETNYGRLKKLESTKVINVYGPTETTIWSSCFVINDSIELSIGSSLANTQIYILDNQNNLLPLGVAGEICIGGDGLARGYLNKPELSAEKFISNPFKAGERIYKTGDIGRWLPDGNVEFLGRKDDQVKIRGYRIELGEIEHVLQGDPDVESCVVLARSNAEGEKDLVAYVVSKKELSLSDLRSSLSSSLPGYMVPSYFVQLDALPLTSNGKINKKALPDPEGLGMSSGSEYVAARNETEEKLIEIWSEILSIDKEKISVKDNFFEIGGHSLKATRLASQIHKIFEVKIELKDLFSNITLEQQGALIDHSLKTSFVNIVPVALQANYALSSSQRRLWVLSQFEDGNAAYNMPGVYVFEGEFNKAALDHSFKMLMERHEILRTYFKEDESGNIRQWITPPEEISFKINHVDLREDAAREEKVRALVQSDSEKLFDLSSGPLLRASLYEVEQDRHVFSYVMHHIISDGWSMEILIREVLGFYNDYINGRSSSLEPLRIQYKDYSAWQQQELSGEGLNAHKQYWLKQFEGDLPVLELQGDRVRPVLKTYNGATQSYQINKKLSQGLKSLSQSQGGTLFMGLLAAVNTLLYRYTNQQDIIIGSPIAGREHSDLDNQIGFYLNTLALRTRFKGEESYADLLNRVKEITLGAYEHQVYPFDELLNDLNLKRDLSRSALFDVMVLLQNTELDGSSQNQVSSGIDIKTYNEVEYQLSKFDLTFDFREVGEEIHFKIEYNTDIYTKETIDRLEYHFISLLEQIELNPKKPIQELNYLSSEEERLLLEDFNSTDVAYPKDKTLVDLFEEQVKASGDKVALVCGSQELTYKQLNERSNQLGDYLRKNYKIKADDLIGIKLDRSIDMIVSILGILKSGGAYVPVDPDYPVERIDYMLSDSGCKVLIDSVELEKFNGASEEYSKKNLKSKSKPEDLAYVIYTSGTTGNPKGSLIEHKNVVRLFKTEQPLFDFTSSDVWTLFHSYCFDFSVWEMYGALLFGGKLVIIPSATAKDPAAYLDVLRSQGVTVLNQTPSSFYNLMKEELSHSGSGLSLRYVIFGGEALSPGKLRDWKARYPDTALINMYGITETTVHVTYKEITQAEISSNASNIGYAIPTLGCYVLDQHQQLSPIGIPGELYVCGAGVARGYLNREELSAERFIDNPFKSGERLYRSGDKVKRLSNGELEYLGRVDDQVKIRGYRIELGEIEHVLQGDPDIESCVVLARSNAEGEKDLVAYVVSKKELSLSDLRSSLSSSLPGYMVPSYFVQLDALPLTSNGKINKKALPDPEGLGMSSGSEYVAARNETEEKLVEIWSEVLSIDKEKISVKDNFFEIGGHSLKATRLASQIHKIFEVKIELKDLFSNITLEQQGALIGHSLKTSFVNIVPVALQANYALSSSQRRLWVLSQFEDGNAAYNMPGVYVFEGEFNKAALDHSFKMLIERHEILRTYFKEDESGNIRQWITPSEQISFKINHVDLREDADREEKVRALVQSDSEKLFDLSSGPLLRASLYEVEPDRHVFSYVMHHIISDGWSMEILIREVLGFYNDYVNGRSSSLEPLRIQYKDYSAWQQQELSGEGLNAHKQYWLKQFEGELPILELQGDRVRPAMQTFNGGTINKRIDSKINQRIKTLSQEKESTLFMALVAGVMVLLYKYTNQQDIIIGTPIAGRKHSDLEDQLGFYANTLALRTKFSEQESYVDLLKRIKEITIDAYEHQIYPFDELVDELKLNRDMSRNPLFDIEVLLMKTAITNTSEMPGELKVVGYEGLENLNTVFDIVFSFVESGEELHLSTVYNTDIYSKETIERLLGHLEEVLFQIIEHPEKPIQELNYLSSEEEGLLLESFNSTAVAYPKDKTLVDLFESQVKLTPDKIALVYGSVELTYKQLDERSNQLANYILMQDDVKPDDLIGLMMERSDRMLVSILGILKSGAGYVPIDPEYPSDRKAFIIKDTGLKLLLTETSHIFDLDYYEGVVFAVDVQLDGLETSLISPGRKIKSTDLAYVIYTSGSTGEPKGVMIEHKTIVNTVHSQQTIFDIREGDRALQFASSSFDASVWEIFAVIASGGTLYIIEEDKKKVPSELEEYITTNKIDFATLPPAYLKLLDLDKIRTLGKLVTAGEAAIAENATVFSVHGKYYNAYGPTESSICATIFEMSKGKAIETNNVPIGRPIANTQIYIVDNHNRLLPIGVVGEICIGGDGLARGYLNKPELSAEKFISNPFKAGGRIYKTGDIGRWLPDGNIEFIGRKDDQVKIRGYRIELGEIEHVLQGDPDIESCVVLARSNAEGEKDLVAYVVSKKELILSDLRSSLSSSLPGYMVPSYFVQLDALPLTSNGKINKKALPDPEGLGMSSGSEYVAARNETEEKLVEIWSEVLSIDKEKISVKDNFFEIGGHSLKATRLVSQIHKIFEVKIELKDLFSNITLEQQGALIGHSLKTSFVNIVPVALQVNYALSSSQQRLWVLNQLGENSLSLVYNIPGVYVFEGEFNKAALDHSFKMLMERHEILRTYFKEDESGNIRQWITPPEEISFKINHVDLREDAAREEKVRALVQSDSEKLFDLSSGPLLRASLYEVEPDRHVFSYVMHHIISDGWSMEILIREVLGFYNDYINGRPSSLEPLRIQYKDYSAWQQQELSGEGLNAHKQYWLKQFEGELPILELQGDRVRPVLKTYNGATQSYQINKKLSQGLKSLSQSQGGTLFMGLLAAVNTLLYRYTNQQDIIIGSPIAGREHSDLDNQIGFYLNTLALRTRFKGEESYADLLNRVKEITLGAYEHQVYPFDELLNDLNLKRDLSRSALFDVMILLQNTELDGSSQNQVLPGIEIKEYNDVEYPLSKFDLTFYFKEVGEIISVSIEYNTDIFDKATIEKLGNYFSQLIEQAIANPELSINEIIYFTEPSAYQLPLSISKVSESNVKCSEHQKRLWFVDQFEKGYLYEKSPVYHNLPIVSKLDNDINVDRLNKSIQKILKSYNVFKTNILVEEGEPRRIVNKKKIKNIHVHEIGGLLNGNDLQEKCKEIINQPFDIEKDLLIRFDLIKNDSDQQIFIITAHHLIADRASLKLLLNEILSDYKGDLSSTVAGALSYASFSEWQSRLYSNMIPLSFYWNKKLKDAPVLYLETDMPREHIHIYEANLICNKITLELSERIESFCSSRNTTPFDFLLAAFNVLLNKYTGNDEIVIGTFSANRTSQKLSGTVGPLANLITLKNVVEDRDDFLNLLTRVKADYSHSLEFGGIPFERVVIDVNPEKDMSRTAIFDVLIHYEEALNKGTSEAEIIELNYGLGKYDLNLLIKKEECFELYLTYNKKYFDSSRMENLLVHYINIVQELLLNPEKALSDITYLSSEEEQLLLEGFNSTDVAYPKDKTLVDLFEEQVKASGDKVALVCGSQELTYKQLNERSNQLADYLRKNYKIKADDLIGIKLGRSIDMIVSILGILKSGGAYVPVDPDYPVERIDYMLSDSGCKVLIDSVELEKFNEASEEYSKKNLKSKSKPEDLAYVIYTSGTTGNPKGSLIEHRNVVRLFKTEQPLFDFTSSDVWTLFHSYCFDFSVWEMYGALLFGGKLVIIPSATAKDPAAYLDVLRSQGVTVLNQTPSSFYNLMKEELSHSGSGLSLRYVIFGGEALSPGKLRDWKARYPDTALINMYGITETTVHVTYKEITETEISSNASNIGYAIPTLGCYVLDQHQQLSPIGIPGELYVCGAGVARGYLNREELSAERFIDNPFKSGERLYRSGDKVKRLSNGELEYLGRVDDQVKIRGYRIELGEIEHVLQGDPDIESCVVLARSNAEGEKDLVAYVVSKKELSLSDLRSSLSSSLPGYMVPSYFVQLDALPLTSNGKINKKALPDPEGLGMSSGSEYVAARNETEEKLIEIWSEILSIDKEKISVKDNFFEIGGHSLKATRLASQIHKIFEVKIELKDLFSNITLEQQGALIGHSLKTSFVNIVPVALQANYALSSSQRRLWVLSQFEDGNAAYNMPGVYVFEGEFNKAALDHSFKMLIERHEILRTYFKEDESGNIRQWITPSEQISFKINHVDLREDADREEKVRALVQSDSEKLFDLSSGPLLRANLYEVEQDRHVFSYVMHHIISDGWSMEILIREVLGFYNDYVNGKPSSLEPLRIQYKDYSAWQQEELSGESLNAHKQYWLKQFEGEFPILNISKKNRPPEYSYKGNALSYIIDSDKTSNISKITKKYNGTDFVSLLFFVKLLLYKYTTSKKIIIGTSLAGRNHHQLENQLGLYINNLPLIIEAKEEFTLEEFYLKIKDMVQGALQHQVYPLEMIINEINYKRDKSRPGLFNVMVEFHNEKPQSDVFKVSDKVEIKALESKTTKSIFDLSFDFYNIADGINVLITYNTDLFNYEEIELMQARFIQLIDNISVEFNKDSTIKELNFKIKEEEKHQESNKYIINENF